MKADKPSATALLIARSQVMLHDAGATAAVDAERARYYRAFAGEAGGKAGTRWLKLMERCSVPGIYLHYALRKLCIERLARERLEAGARQVVVIAAGLDPLSAMLHGKYKDVAFFELDHPATQAVKRRALEKMGRGGNLSLPPVDLTKQTLTAALAGTSFSPDLPTLFIAEGITMYLTAAQINSLFAQLRACARHAESHFLFTYMNRQESGSIQFGSATWLTSAWLWIKNESFRWGIAAKDLPAFLSAHGCSMITHADADDLAAAYLEKKAVLARGENICLARLAGQ